MDATKRPVKIPPEFGAYADKHGIFDLYKRLLAELVIARPDDPLTFISKYLEREDDDVPHIILLGPPESGRRTISRMICRALGTVLVTEESLWSDPDIIKDLKELGVTDSESRRSLEARDWARLVKIRLNKSDALKRGWVLVNLPQTREQQKAMADLGIFPKHCVVLEAPDSVLIGRIEGKRIDPVTGDTYHETYDWPTNKSVANRLIRPASLDIEVVIKRLVEHRRNMDLVLQHYQHISQVINADQPKADVYDHAMHYICQPESSCAPRLPRIVLIGPPGSGRHAHIVPDLVKSYRFVSVDVEQLVKEAIAGETKFGVLCKAAVVAGLPISDSLLIDMLRERLSKRDCCTRGWVLVGFPLNRDQAMLLSHAGFTPNRVLVLDVSKDSIIERLSLRGTDPLTGSHHHLMTDPPRTIEARQRMATHPDDKEAKLLQKIEAHYSRIKEVEEFYGNLVRHVNADQDAYNVCKTVESFVVRPLPKCSA